MWNSSCGVLLVLKKVQVLEHFVFWIFSLDVLNLSNLRQADVPGSAEAWAGPNARHSWQVLKESLGEVAISTLGSSRVWSPMGGQQLRVQVSHAAPSE